MPDICFWNKCNNRCIMCTNPKVFSLSSPEKNYDLKTQILKWNNFLKGKKVYENSDDRTYINITGGEPTLHPDFFALLWYLRKKEKNLPITLLTNGRKFSNKDFALKFSKIAAQPFSVAVAFHCSKEKIFEKITGIKNSFKETLLGIDNLFKYFNGEIEIRIVLHKLNIKYFKETVEFLKKRYSRFKNWHITIIHYEIEGIAFKNKKKVYLPLKKSSEIIYKNFDVLKDINFRLYHFPLCVVNPILRKYCMITLPIEERVYTKKCKKCILKKNCVGLMIDYYRLYGDSELKTIKK